MSGKLFRAVGLVSVVVVVLLSLLGSHPAANASSGITSLVVDNLDCSNFSFHVLAAAPGNWAGIRIWIGSSSGQAIVDSYRYGYPGGYWLLDPNTGTSNSVVYAFAVQPSGTTLVARVYRALDPAPGSWDGGNYVDTTVQCHLGIHNVTNASLNCGNTSGFEFSAHSLFASPTGGYAAVRLWINGTPYYDSYVAGYPFSYVPINSSGNLTPPNIVGVNFPPQPAGTVIKARIYHALAANPGSWDGGDYYDLSTTCVAQPTITPTP